LYFLKQYFSVDNISDCGITAAGTKAISSFLSQDGIVLEELNLGLKEQIKRNHNHQITEGNKLEMKVLLILLKV